MPIEVAPPKYVTVANAVQRRIEDGTYPPGSKLPSETELIAEFDASRPVVVRALGILQQDGWIDSHQGKGRFVRGRPAVASRQAPGHLGGLLGEEQGGVQLLRAGPVLVPSRAAAVLGIDPGTPVISRQRLVSVDVGPVELSTVYVPVELAAGTALGKKDPLPAGLLRYLGQHKGVEFDHAVERISARTASAEEANTLGIARRELVLTLLITVYDRAGQPQLAVDAVIPVSRHEIEDVFPLN